MDEDAGVDDASALGLVTCAAVVSAVVVVVMLSPRAGTAPSVRAAALGVRAGLLFGLAAGFAKPVIDDLQVGLAEAAGDWRTWTLLGFGFATLLAAPGGAALITLANRETHLPGEPTGRSGALTDETLT